MIFFHPTTDKNKGIIRNAKWLFLLTIAMAIFLVCLVIVALDKKRGYTELHRQVNENKRVLDFLIKTVDQRFEKQIELNQYIIERMEQL